VLSERHKFLLNKITTIDDMKNELNDLLYKIDQHIGELKYVESQIHKVIEEKTKGFPWLSDALAQYFENRDLKIAEFLEKKLRPAVSSAERVREIAREKRILEKKFRVTRNLIKYYESLFPWLPEFVGEDIDDLVEQVAALESKKQEDVDPITMYLTEGEYERLSPTERNQRALDRYWRKKKFRWELGRDYERYIGYIYEKDGYAVFYQGIVEGLEDLGRDLIARKERDVEVIQCKRWAQHKRIHEKHICQLFGTTLKYWIENQKKLPYDSRTKAYLFPELLRRKEIKGTFVTSTTLSETAREFAKELGIEVKEQFPFQLYPSIKCNVSRKTGEKIYHLPMDQQYDRTVIEEERTECYVETVAEAERLGFRRAWRWRGSEKTRQGQQ